MTKNLSTISYRANLLSRCKKHSENAKSIINRWSRLSEKVSEISLETELAELMLSARLAGLVTAVETLLNDTLTDIYTAYPIKLGKKNLTIQDLHTAGAFLQTIKIFAKRSVSDLSYKSFKDYLSEWQKIVTKAPDITDEKIATFSEIKATRDLYVHNNGNINDIYESVELVTTHQFICVTP